jgi:hypothetical protein
MLHGEITGTVVPNLKTVLGSIPNEDVMWEYYRNRGSKSKNCPGSIPVKDVTWGDYGSRGL